MSATRGLETFSSLIPASETCLISSSADNALATSFKSSSRSNTSSQASASYSLASAAGSSFHSAIDSSSRSASVFKSSTFSIAFFRDSYSSRPCSSTSMMIASIFILEVLAVSFINLSGGSSTYLLSVMDSASSSANISHTLAASFSDRSGVWYRDRVSSWLPIEILMSPASSTLPIEILSASLASSVWFCSVSD